MKRMIFLVRSHTDLICTTFFVYPMRTILLVRSIHTIFSVYILRRNCVKLRSLLPIGTWCAIKEVSLQRELIKEDNSFRRSITVWIKVDVNPDILSLDWITRGVLVSRFSWVEICGRFASEQSSDFPLNVSPCVAFAHLATSGACRIFWGEGGSLDFWKKLGRLAVHSFLFDSVKTSKNQMVNVAGRIARSKAKPIRPSFPVICYW